MRSRARLGISVKMTLGCSTSRHLRQLALLDTWGGRTPRYTSYPTAAQFTPEVGPEDYAVWLGALDQARPVSVYIHIPFCARLCWYCGCNTRVVNRGERIADYVALLADELSIVGERLPARFQAAAIHLGGGTPNMLGQGELDTLFSVLRSVFEVASDAEIAAEIDPSQLTPEWAQSRGVARIEPREHRRPRSVSRGAGGCESPRAIRGRGAGRRPRLRDAGVTSLNFDLMYGLPRQRVAGVLYDARQTLDEASTRPPRPRLATLTCPG